MVEINERFQRDDLPVEHRKKDRAAKKYFASSMPSLVGAHWVYGNPKTMLDFAENLLAETNPKLSEEFSQATNRKAKSQKMDWNEYG